jgi:hypothetical protein
VSSAVDTVSGSVSTATGGEVLIRLAAICKTIAAALVAQSQAGRGFVSTASRSSGGTSKTISCGRK